VVTALDNSCLMQIYGGLHRAGSTVRTMHLAEVLASDGGAR
jgi:L-lactate dehydrogenase complex protein LldE